jgi:hypothetical protein
VVTGHERTWSGRYPVKVATSDQSSLGISRMSLLLARGWHRATDLFVPKPARRLSCLPRCLAGLRLGALRRPQLLPLVVTQLVTHLDPGGSPMW